MVHCVTKLRGEPWLEYNFPEALNANRPVELVCIQQFLCGR